MRVETGIGLEPFGDLGAGFTTFASVVCVRGENDDSGADLPGIPPLKARYGLRYETSFGSDTRLWAEICGLTASSQDHLGPNKHQTDAYTRGDVRLGVDFGDTWSLVAAVENFTDKLYQACPPSRDSPHGSAISRLQDKKVKERRNAFAARMKCR